ncbi:MAG: hypothetical protein A3F18_01460 [Legionellales bacterium RIFCSPHIGHO2_12_FULL_37_14]|nr:MAG: hypothetical protein A3F18_01460 [Legionellales bacterium RIFCSPHIGHO2_12_FULL_37_14]
MPIYEYVCKKCSHHFEVLQKLASKEKPFCPACKARKVERIVSAAGFQLKGTGWYATDFKSTPRKEKEVKPDAAPKKDEKKAPQPANDSSTSKAE